MSADGSLGKPGTRPEPPALPAREAETAKRPRRTALQRLEKRGREELAALSNGTKAARPAPLQACVDWDLALCPVPSPGLASGD